MITRAVAWFFTIPYLLVSFGSLVLVHPFLAIFSKCCRPAFWIAVQVTSFLLLAALRIVGYSVRVDGTKSLPPIGPVIIVSNHQSLLDIPLLAWVLRRFNPRFVAKRELAKGFPAVSLVLRESGAALVDRGDKEQALGEIRRCAREMYSKKAGMVIFPEGTRSRDGALKEFKPGGLLAICAEMPDAPIVLATISGTHRIFRHNLFPVPFGGKLLVNLEVIPDRSALPTGLELTNYFRTKIADKLKLGGQA